MNRTVDDKLGNDVQYSAGGPDLFRSIKAFIVLPTDVEFQNFDVVDPLNQHERLKVRKELVPTPSKADIIRHPRLPADMRPENWVSSREGDYWLIDLQKA